MKATLEAPTDDNAGSITVHLAALKRGDCVAQEWLFERLLPQVLELARRRIGRSPTRYHDEFELAIEVLGSLLMQASGFDKLHDRTDLARLLNRLVRNKSVDAYRRMRRRQRMEVGESWVSSFSNDASGRRRFRSGEFSAEAMQIIATELFDSLMHTIRILKENELQCGQILKLIVEGYSVAEVSQIVGRGERSIYRLLARIEREFYRSVDSSR
ncbi:MAG: hypothetical protein IT422_00740 [Pirellulaceae bacterium]|nr:hypothetical protein [Pirellulaceae bacterium]